MKKLILLPLVALMLTGCGNKEPEQPKSTEAVITAAIGGYTDEGQDPGYKSSDAAVELDALKVSWEALGFYGHDYETKELKEAGGWLQFRSKNGGSKLHVESSRPIASVKIVIPDCQGAFDNTNCWDAKFGDDATVAGQTISVDTIKDQKVYTITPTVQTYKFFSLINGTETHTHYAKSVTVTYAD